MKRLLSVLAFLAIGMIASAQIATAKLTEDNTYYEYTTDVTLTNTTAQYFLIEAPKDWYSAQNAVIWIDSLAGNLTNVAIAVSGRMTDVVATRGGGVATADAAAWTAIGSTINWKGVSGDTIIVFSNATENAYRYYKVTFTGTGVGTATIKNFEWKLWQGIP
jgi:hypothetical protein